MSASKQAALSIYRSLLREAAKMPTPHRTKFVRQRAREAFEQNRNLKAGGELEEALLLGETMVDATAAQRVHLNELVKMGELKGG